MTFTQHYVVDERLVRSVMGELVLDLRLDNIEKAFHLLPSDQLYNISYETMDQWYRENRAHAEEF